MADAVTAPNDDKCDGDSGDEQELESTISANTPTNEFRAGKVNSFVQWLNVKADLVSSTIWDAFFNRSAMTNNKTKKAVPSVGPVEEIEMAVFTCEKGEEAANLTVMTTSLSMVHPSRPTSDAISIMAAGEQENLEAKRRRRKKMMETRGQRRVRFNIPEVEVEPRTTMDVADVLAEPITLPWHLSHLLRPRPQFLATNGSSVREVTTEKEPEAEPDSIMWGTGNCDFLFRTCRNGCGCREAFEKHRKSSRNQKDPALKKKKPEAEPDSDMWDPGNFDFLFRNCRNGCGCREAFEKHHRRTGNQKDPALKKKEPEAEPDSNWEITWGLDFMFDSCTTECGCREAFEAHYWSHVNQEDPVLKKKEPEAEPVRNWEITCGLDFMFESCTTECGCREAFEAHYRSHLNQEDPALKKEPEAEPVSTSD